MAAGYPRTQIVAWECQVLEAAGELVEAPTSAWSRPPATAHRKAPYQMSCLRFDGHTSGAGPVVTDPKDHTPRSLWLSLPPLDQSLPCPQLRKVRKLSSSGLAHRWGGWGVATTSPSTPQEPCEAVVWFVRCGTRRFNGRLDSDPGPTPSSPSGLSSKYWGGAIQVFFLKKMVGRRLGVCFFHRNPSKRKKSCGVPIRRYCREGSRRG